MPPENIFYGIIMTYDTVFTYYKNPAHKKFHHFVFQPMIDDVEVGDFTLATYAVNEDLTVLNDGNMLPTEESEDNGFTGTKPNIQFANMNLGLDALAALYPTGGAKLDLKVYPPGGYYSQNGKETAYVLYVAHAGDGNVTVGSPNVPINPSPPA